MNHNSGRWVLSPLAIPNPHNYGIDIVLHFLRVVYIFKFYFKMSLKFVYSGNHHEFSIATWPIWDMRKYHSSFVHLLVICSNNQQRELCLSTWSTEVPSKWGHTGSSFKHFRDHFIMIRLLWLRSDFNPYNWDTYLQIWFLSSSITVCLIFLLASSWYFILLAHVREMLQK